MASAGALLSTTKLWAMTISGDPLVFANLPSEALIVSEGPGDLAVRPCHGAPGIGPLTEVQFVVSALWAPSGERTFRGCDASVMGVQRGLS